MNLYRNELIQKYKEAGRYDKTLSWWLDHLEKGNLCDADVMRLVAEIDRLKVREKRDCAAILELREKLKEANDRANELYCELEKWKDSLDPRDAEIDNLRERLAELDFAEIENVPAWNDANNPPEGDTRWVILEIPYRDKFDYFPAKYITHWETADGWIYQTPYFDDSEDMAWYEKRNGNLIHSYAPTRWRELPRGGKNE